MSFSDRNKLFPFEYDNKVGDIFKIVSNLYQNTFLSFISRCRFTLRNNIKHNLTSKSTLKTSKQCVTSVQSQKLSHKTDILLFSLFTLKCRLGNTETLKSFFILLPLLALAYEFWIEIIATNICSLFVDNKFSTYFQMDRVTSVLKTLDLILNQQKSGNVPHNILDINYCGLIHHFVYELPHDLPNNLRLILNDKTSA